jgi:hypothetical protein
MNYVSVALIGAAAAFNRSTANPVTTNLPPSSVFPAR